MCKTKQRGNVANTTVSYIVSLFYRIGYRYPGPLTTNVTLNIQILVDQKQHNSVIELALSDLNIGVIAEQTHRFQNVYNNKYLFVFLVYCIFFISFMYINLQLLIFVRTNMTNVLSGNKYVLETTITYENHGGTILVNATVDLRKCCSI